eukprot:gene55098-6289_t
MSLLPVRRCAAGSMQRAAGTAAAAGQRTTLLSTWSTLSMGQGGGATADGRRRWLADMVPHAL